jgi:Pep3/Vps18/deep orange family
VLKTSSLKQIEYLKKEGDQPVEGELPTGFAISLFHICFMYPTNITVVSKISREIVYNQNFKDERILRGIHMNVFSNQLLAFSPAKIISVASLKGEDKDAWKYYLKKANIKMALDSCTGNDSGKQRGLVNGTHADSLFNTGNF